MYTNYYSWYKLLPKKGDLFNAVMEHLRSLGMAQKSANHAFLRDAIVQNRMDLLRGFMRGVPVVQTLTRRNDVLMSPEVPYQEARLEMLGFE